MTFPFRRVLVLGARGMLGTDLLQLLRRRLPGDRVLIGADIDEFDLTRRETTLGWVKDQSPDLVINCAAYTNVERAEDERDQALAVNRDGAGNAAEAAAAGGAAFCHISTDFIFNGEQDTPYLEEDSPNPLSVYGFTKLQGELAVQERHPSPLIVRTSWLYGYHGGNFVRTMLRLGPQKKELKVVDDQVGRPTYTADLAGWIVALIEAGATGTVVHAANDGECSWYSFARRIFEIAGLAEKVRVTPTTSAEFGAKAPRPPFSVLSLDKLSGLLGHRPRPWDEALKDFLESYEVQGGGGG